MKKRLLAAAIAASMTMSLGVALAAPVEFDGEAEVHYQWDDNDANSDKEEGARNTVILNAKTALGENVDFYLRFAAQRYHGDDITADFNTESHGKSTATIDRFGFILKGDNATYNLGRQGFDIGPNALLYSTSGNIGSSTTLLDGLTAEATLGVTDIQFYAGQETDSDNKLYALHAGFQPSEAWTLGATLARYNYDESGVDNTNHWGIDTSYTHANTTYFAEYAKSNEDDDNKAFIVGVSHDLDDKNSLSLAYAKVEQLADIGGNTDFDAGYKGLYFGYDHKLTDNTTVSLAYSDLKDINSRDKYNYTEATINYAF